ncbi:MAG: hypothetical protein SV186_02225 [Candidatus Nanohaloarchaea archaeon]|nr:hypothetical protein [Candidatus Nanohaloarchaea archaeon]
MERLQKIRRFLGTMKHRFLVFLAVDTVVLYWLLFRAKLVCVQGLTGPPRTSCYSLFSHPDQAIFVNEKAVAAIAVVLSIVAYLAVEGGYRLATRLRSSERQHGS